MDRREYMETLARNWIQRLTESVHEEQMIMLDSVDLGVLLIVRQLSSNFKDVVDKQLSRRRKNSLANFLKEVDEFLVLLDHTKSYVSGSVAASVIFPDLFDNDPLPEDFPPDLDIYTRPSLFNLVIEHLESKEGYSVLGASTVTEEQRVRYESVGIGNVISLRKDNRSIDVVVSTTESALYPIMHFHLTAAMNAFSGDNFYMFYRELTLNRESVLSDTAFENCQVFDINGLREVNAFAYAPIEKYIRRGFRVKQVAHGFGFLQQTLCKNFKCRGYRYSDDVDVLCLPIPFENAPHIASRSLTLRESRVRWFLGGYPCVPNHALAREYYQPFSVGLCDD